MREKFKYAGQTVKTKQGVGTSSFGQDMSGQDFIVEDWWENVGGVFMDERNWKSGSFRVRYTSCEVRR